MEVSGLRSAVKLMDSMVDRSQNYYGIAIRSNVGDLPRQLVQCFSIVPHQKKTNGMTIGQKEATVGVNTNKIFQIRRQPMFQDHVSQSLLFFMQSKSLSNYLKMLFSKSAYIVKTQYQNESFRDDLAKDTERC